MALAKTKISSPLEVRVGQTRAEITQQYRDSGSQAASTVNQQSILPGVLIKDMRFVVGKNTYVNHGLGRVPNGYILCNVRADPTQSAATGAQGCQRNSASQDPSNNERFTLSLGPWQPFLADVWVY